MGQPRLEITGLSKAFGASQALKDASLTVQPGEIHGLVGENGSGKSTLVKLLSGYHAPDAGSLWVDGRPVGLPVRPAAMRECGLSVVHQDLGLIDSFSVVENMRIGQFGVRRLSRAIRWRRERELARLSLRALGAEIDPEARVSELSAAERAEVAIARALQHHDLGRGLVMFDESTRALPPELREHFHSLLKDVVARGGSVLLVSHQLDEVLDHTDCVTVLRDGHVVAGSTFTSELSEHELIRLMLGRELSLESSRRMAATTHKGDNPASEVKGLTGRLISNVSLTVATGEVLGITGLLGSGFEELPYLLAGARRAQCGTLTIANNNFDLSRSSPRQLLDAGVALVPERRDTEGLALSMSVLENVTLPRVQKRGSPGHIRRAWQKEEADTVIREFDVRPANPDKPVAQLSGGNQQKVMLGKWLCGEPNLLLLHEPTQGVDVAARRELEAAIARAADNGCGVILAGMDMSQLAYMCDRVLVIREGGLADELVDELTPDRIIKAVYRSPNGALAA